MTRVYYSDISRIEKPDHVFEYIKLFPPLMQQEITRYRNRQDQLSRLIARLLLLRALKDAGYNAALLNDLKRDHYSKPYLPLKEHFSISHSGHYVLLAFSDKKIGADIEQKQDLNYAEFADYFHPHERQVLNKENNPDLFFKLWTKKEAILKLLGKGLLNGLSEYSCLEDQVNLKGRIFFFYPLDLDPAYACTLCTEGAGQERHVIEYVSVFNDVIAG